MPSALCSSPADLLSVASGTIHLFSAGPRGGAGGEGLLERQEDLDLRHVQGCLAAAANCDVALRDPHFSRLASGADGTVAIHVGDLGRSCPLPGAINVQVVRRRELFELARERMNRSGAPFRRLLLGMMDHLLLLEPVERLSAYGVMDLFDGLSLLQLGNAAGGQPSLGGRAKPIQHRPAAFQTGPYNYLGHPDRPPLGSLHLRILVERAAAAGQAYAVLVASPETIEEAGLLMRVFRALAEGGSGAEMLVLFFGSPEELEASVEDRAGATFFGDNFTSPAVRCLFAPFSEAEVMLALRQAAAVFDTAYGGTLERLAERLGLPCRLTVAPDGRFAEWKAGQQVTGTLDLADLFTDAAIRERGRKTDRGAERMLLRRFEELFPSRLERR